jgi:hypothetical protein
MAPLLSRVNCEAALAGGRQDPGPPGLAPAAQRRIRARGASQRRGGAQRARRAVPEANRDSNAPGGRRRAAALPGEAVGRQSSSLLGAGARAGSRLPPVTLAPADRAAWQRAGRVVVGSVACAMGIAGARAGLEARRGRGPSFAKPEHVTNPSPPALLPAPACMLGQSSRHAGCAGAGVWFAPAASAPIPPCVSIALHPAGPMCRLVTWPARIILPTSFGLLRRSVPVHSLRTRCALCRTQRGRLPDQVRTWAQLEAAAQLRAPSFARHQPQQPLLPSKRGPGRLPQCSAPRSSCDQPHCCPAPARRLAAVEIRLLLRQPTPCSPARCTARTGRRAGQPGCRAGGRSCWRAAPPPAGARRAAVVALAGLLLLLELPAAAAAAAAAAEWSWGGWSGACPPSHKRGSARVKPAIQPDAQAASRSSGTASRRGPPRRSPHTGGHLSRAAAADTRSHRARQSL